jgi:hypothetical protein
MGVENNQQATRQRTSSETVAFDQGYEAGRRDTSLSKAALPQRGEVAGCNSGSIGGMRAISQEERIAELFKYHAPREDQLPKYDAIRTAAKHFAEILLKNTTYGADQSDALRKLRECVMVANASVALDGLS